jgi:hypothetical protein
VDQAQEATNAVRVRHERWVYSRLVPGVVWLRAGGQRYSPCSYAALSHHSLTHTLAGTAYTEILCKGKGDTCCQFIICPPHKMKEHVKRYASLFWCRRASEQTY